VRFSFNALTVNQKTISIKVVVKDINENSWTETLKFDIFRKKYRVNIGSTTANVKGYITMPNNKQKPIDMNIGYIEIPSLNSDDYYIVLANPNIVGETAYSIGFQTTTANLSNFSETSHYEATNGTKAGAEKIGRNTNISAYLHIGDIDFYKISTYDGKVATISSFNGSVDENALANTAIEKINIVNIGGGLPIKYVNSKPDIKIILKKIKDFRKFLNKNNIKDVQVKTFEYEDSFITHGKTSLVEESLGLLPSQIAQFINEDTNA